MSPLDPKGLADGTAQGLAADARSLDSLKRAAARDPKAALKGAARQFEALFLQMVLKSMRDAVPKSGLLDSDSQQTYTGMLDQQLATKISKSGTGLADVIARQLGRFMNDGKAAPAQVSAAPPRAAIDRYSGMAAVSPRAPLHEGERAHANAPERTADPENGTEGAVASAARSLNLDAPAGVGETTLGYAERTFVSRMWDHAVAAQRATGIPARFVLAQAALESGWGQREMRDASGLPTYNLFGIKAGAGWRGRTVDVVTTEYDNGVARKVVETFRAYNNYSESFRDWAQLIAGSKRYAQAVESGRAGGNGADFAAGLARAGYATDPEYGAKLARVIGTLAGALASAG